MAGVLSQVRRLSGNLSRHLYGDTISHLPYAAWTCAVTTSVQVPRLPSKHFYCTDSSREGTQLSTEEREQPSPTQLREIKAENVLKNLPEDEKVKLERLKAEYESWKAELRQVPSQMSNSDWLKMMEKNTISSRKKFYSYLMSKEFQRAKRKILQEKKRQEREERKAEEGELKRYEFGTFIHSVRHKMKDPRRIKGCQSMMFGNPLVFDFDVGVQKDREAKNLMFQLSACYGINMEHPEPFNLHYCGIPETGSLAEEFRVNYLSNPNSNWFIDFHNKDLCDVFPKERLVYLTPQSKTYLKYNSNDIYVIGALVDLHDTKPYTFAKAKKLGLRTACLPLDKYYRLKKNKSLTLDTVLKVMLDINFTRHWQKAMIHIPPRYWDMVRTEKLREHWDQVEAEKSRLYQARMDREALECREGEHERSEENEQNSDEFDNEELWTRHRTEKKRN